MIGLWMTVNNNDRLMIVLKGKGRAEKREEEWKEEGGKWKGVDGGAGAGGNMFDEEWVSK